MFITVELVFKSHMPKQLEPGLWFITKINPGTRKEYSEVWELDKHPTESLEEFISNNGAPVEPYLMYDEQILADPDEIGWWDAGHEVEVLRDITLKDINHILEEWDGYVDVEIDEDLFDEEDEIRPIAHMDKVVLCIPGLYDEEEEDDDEGPWLCNNCNGSGYGATPDVACPVCHGEGEIYLRDDDDIDEHTGED